MDTQTNRCFDAHEPTQKLAQPRMHTLFFPLSHTHSHTAVQAGGISCYEYESLPD